MRPDSFGRRRPRCLPGAAWCPSGRMLSPSLAAAGSDGTVGNLGIPRLSGGHDFGATDPRPEDLVRQVPDENPRNHSTWARTQASLHRLEQAKSLPGPPFSERYFAQPTETRVGPMKHGFEIPPRLDRRSDASPPASGSGGPVPGRLENHM